MADDPIEREIKDDLANAAKRGRGRSGKDADANRNRRRLGTDMIEALKKCDSRRYADLLRRAGAQDDSLSWKRAWEIFYAECPSSR